MAWLAMLVIKGSLLRVDARAKGAASDDVLDTLTEPALLLVLDGVTRSA